MSNHPATADDREEGAAPGMGDEDGGAMNESSMEYIDRAQDQSGTAEIEDSFGRSYTVTLEDLVSVGVDISESNTQLQITEEQMSALLSIVAPDDCMNAGPMKADEYEDEANSGDQVTLSILYDGSVKLVGAGNGHESYYSQSQLAEINIDSHNMSDEDIKRIVQLAGAANGEAVHYDDVPEKRRKLAGSGPSSVASGGADERREREGGGAGGGRGQQQAGQRSYQNSPSLSSASTSGNAAGPSGSIGGSRPQSAGERARDRAPLTSGLIGESVKLRNSKGNIVHAVVRYSIPTRGYKVQYPDGKFEWVPQERIIDRAPRMPEMRDYDHKGYTSEPPSSLQQSGAVPSTSSGGPLMLTRRVIASSSGVPGVHAGGPRTMPVRHLTHIGGGGGGHQHQQQEGRPGEPNFTCPVCDKKVYQKEPAYIVIRLPACDVCTREKILIVDETTTTTTTATTNGGERNGGERSRPATREIATDTSDLHEMEEEERREEKSSIAPSTASSPDEEATTPEERDREGGGSGGEGTEREESPEEKRNQGEMKVVKKEEETTSAKENTGRNEPQKVQ